MSADWSPFISLLALLLVANGAPAVVAVFAAAHAWPVDGGRVLWDGRPALGPSKTWRGLVAASVATPATAWALGLEWWLGLMVALGAMAGDLIVSFTKRRLALPSSTSVPLWDQLPETLIPALLARQVMGLDWRDLVLAVGAFVVLDLVLTPVLKRLGPKHRRRVRGSSSPADS